MKKRMLALAVMSTVFSVGFVMSANAAENADQKLSQYSVDEVIVEGSRDLLPGGFVKSTSNVGIMGKKSIMETPYVQAEKILPSISRLFPVKAFLVNILMLADVLAKTSLGV